MGRSLQDQLLSKGLVTQDWQKSCNAEELRVSVSRRVSTLAREERKHRWRNPLWRHWIENEFPKDWRHCCCICGSGGRIPSTELGYVIPDPGCLDVLYLIRHSDILSAKGQAARVCHRCFGEAKPSLQKGFMAKVENLLRREWHGRNRKKFEPVAGIV